MDVDQTKRELERKLARRLRGTLTKFMADWRRHPDKRTELIVQTNLKMRRFLQTNHHKTTVIFSGTTPNQFNTAFAEDTNFLMGRIVQRLNDNQYENMPVAKEVAQVRRWATGAAQRIVQRDAESGRLIGAKLHPKAVFKKWISVMDGVERPGHHDAHLRYLASPISLNQPFIIGRWRTRMMHPGDQSMGAGPDNIMNCRCSVIYVDAAGRAVSRF